MGVPVTGSLEERATSAAVLVVARHALSPEIDVVVEGESCPSGTEEPWLEPSAKMPETWGPGVGRRPAIGVAEVNDGPPPPSLDRRERSAPGWIIRSVASRDVNSGSPRVTCRGVFFRMYSARGPRM